MMEDVRFWLLAIAVSSFLAIWGRHPSRMPLHWAFKPIVAMLLMVAVWRMAPLSATRTLALVALGLSLAGDVILMLPQRFFIWGLLSFLAALITYAIGFSFEIAWSWLHLVLLLPPLALASPVLRGLWPHLGKLRVPVALYVTVMVLMVWRMLCRYELDLAPYLAGAVGGFLFLTADTLLAFRRFAGRKVPYAIELGPYFAGQWCLAMATFI